VSDEPQIAIVGAGVIGLAIARAAALAGLNPILLDQADLIGSGISSRNSEVIHAGIYYPQGSLKARLCVAGRAMLYRYCEDKGVPHRRLGKLIVAARAGEVAALDAIEAAALACGVTDLVRMDASEASALEPALHCHQALHSPSTGIVDSGALMMQMLADMENAGGQFVAHSRVTRLTRGQDGGWNIHLAGEDAPALCVPMVVNAAALSAHRLASATEGLDQRHAPPLRYARGNYFTYSGRIPFSRLIYPVPVPGGLGTHLTLDMAGQARFGPDVEWIEGEPDFSVDPARKPAFLAAARLIWADLDEEKLQPGYAGIRPKLSGPGEAAADFRIDGPEVHELDGLVNLFGIESPGLTSSLALADLVMEKLGVIGP
jgi:L-2-hydroxyglutarate oxidase LhgO